MPLSHKAGFYLLGSHYVSALVLRKQQVDYTMSHFVPT